MSPSDVASPSPADRRGAPGAPAPAERRVPVGWIILLVTGALVSLLALAPLVGGGALLWADATQKDDDGFFTTPSERLETTTYAITSEEIDLGADPTGRSTRVDLGDLATVRIEVSGVEESATFVGIGPAGEVEEYLSDVARAEVRDLRFDPFGVDYRYRDGGEPPTPPGDATFWVASAEGPGAQRLEWEPESGDWAVVIMNADGSPGVAVEATLAASSPWVWRIGVILSSLGAVALLVGVTMLVVSVVGLARRSHIELAGVEHHPDGQPVHLEGHLDEPLNRWLWLVKWFLLIPHAIVLVVLWMAFAVVTVVAFFAILFTGRYPRPLFDFNVGVLRWTWRVTYYGYSALGTDRYPPFSLGAEPDYPATLSIVYPQRLSRGLVLVKWWLLAIPHYLILSVIAGGAMAGTDRGVWWATGYPFGGFIGLLVVFAAIGLLVTSRYPRGLFDLVLGLNRWVFRVIAYVALMRDDYPPFRLDQGGDEPGPRPVPPSGEPPQGEARRPERTAGDGADDRPELAGSAPSV
jgi:hypothetical protein